MIDTDGTDCQRNMAAREDLCLLLCLILLFSFGKLFCLDDGRFENVAFNKSCDHSSSWDTNHPAKYAVNGNINGTFFHRSNCIHTKEDDNSPWWQVNLGRPYPVYNITVWGRTGFVDRLSHLVITVDKEQCYKFGSLSKDNALRKQTVTCNQVINGSVVRIARVLPGTGDDPTIQMCEFEVYSCSARYWGSDCDQECGQCSGGVPCDKVTGRCDHGCQPGYEPPLCTECVEGLFGDNCSQECSPNCAANLTCDKSTGHCQSCQEPGRALPMCDTDCPDGRYEQDCRLNCSSNCGEVCDKVSGLCSCAAGWKGEFCSEECEAGTYGLNCSEVCGSCSDGPKSCDTADGSCTSCKENFRMPLCKERADAFQGSIIIITVTAVTSGVAAIVLIVVCVVVIRWRCSPSQKPEEATVDDENQDTADGRANSTFQNTGELDEESIGAPPAEAEPNVAAPQKKQRKPKAKPRKHRPIYENLKSTRSSASTTEAHRVSTNQNSCVESTTKRVSFEKTKANRTPSVVFLPRSNLTKGIEHPAAFSDVSMDDAMEETDDASHAYYNDIHYMTSQEAALGLDGIQQYLLDKLRGETLDGQFQLLERGHPRLYRVGSTQENKSKNRFHHSILPYDENRVILRGQSNDYINASHIRGYGDKSYIAAQVPGAPVGHAVSMAHRSSRHSRGQYKDWTVWKGPNEKTMGDFWQMVWQEKTTHIVMLTNLTEGGKNKCVQYWPSRGVRNKYGLVYVTGLAVLHRANHVLRTFDVKGKGGGPGLHVTQYHFTTWPDHQVPTATALVDFWRTVIASHRNQRAPSALLVHCSAGVGRTGTFIALDVAMDTVQSLAEVNVLKIVERLREDRVRMVHTRSQYRFLHEAILEAYTSRHTHLPLLVFRSIFPGDVQPGDTHWNHVDSEFKLLNQMKVLLHKPTHTAAENEQNVDKNRRQDVLPDDNHLVCLISPVSGRNQYINAVYMPTFFDRRGCIVTQLPLSHTLVDIWRLVDGSDVHTVVSLGAEVDGTEAGCCYWPRSKDQAMQFGPYKVTLVSEAKLGQYLISYQLSLKKASCFEREVYILHFTGWTGEVADDTAELLHLIDLVTGRFSIDDDDDNDDDDARPVIVQCLDGASKSGLFRAICDVMSRLWTEQAVDVYMAVRHVQIVRPQCVASLEQYRYIYQVIQEDEKRNSVYTNLSH